MNLLLILTGAALVMVPLLTWPRTAAHLLIATADAAAAFRGSWKRRGRAQQIKAVAQKAAALDQVQIDTVSALKNYGMTKPDAEVLVRLVGTASDVPALLARAMQSRGKRAA
jgi:hypothetical protein